VTHDPVIDDYARRLLASGLGRRELDDLAASAQAAVGRGDVELARERAATALGDACAALGSPLLRGRGDRDDCTVEELRARGAASLAHEALKVLAGERDTDTPTPSARLDATSRSGVPSPS
jgi:hypothetical protein